jgi:hypothetical protein
MFVKRVRLRKDRFFLIKGRKKIPRCIFLRGGQSCSREYSTTIHLIRNLITDLTAHLTIHLITHLITHLTTHSITNSITHLTAQVSTHLRTHLLHTL